MRQNYIILKAIKAYIHFNYQLKLHYILLFRTEKFIRNGKFVPMFICDKDFINLINCLLLLNSFANSILKYDVIFGSSSLEQFI